MSSTLNTIDDLFRAVATGTLDECYQELSNFDKYTFESDEMEELENCFLPHLVVKTKTYIITLPDSQLKSARNIKKKFTEFKKATFNINSSKLVDVVKQLDDIWNMVDSGEEKKEYFQWDLYNYNTFDVKRKEYFTFDDNVNNGLILNIKTQTSEDNRKRFLNLVKYKNELQYFWHYIYPVSIITNANTLLSLAQLFNFEEEKVEIEFKKQDSHFILQLKNDDDVFEENVNKKDFENKYDVLKNSCYRVCGHRLDKNYNIFVYYESKINAFEKNTNDILNPVMLAEALSEARYQKHGLEDVEGQAQINSSGAFKIAVQCALAGINVIGSSYDEKIEEFTLEQIKQRTGDSVNKALSKLDIFLNTIVDKYNTYINSKFIERSFIISLKNGRTFITSKSQDISNSELNIKKLEVDSEANIEKSDSQNDSGVGSSVATTTVTGEAIASVVAVASTFFSKLLEKDVVLWRGSSSDKHFISGNKQCLTVKRLKEALLRNTQMLEQLRQTHAYDIQMADERFQNTQTLLNQQIQMHTQKLAGSQHFIENERLKAKSAKQMKKETLNQMEQEAEAQRELLAKMQETNREMIQQQKLSNERQIQDLINQQIKVEETENFRRQTEQQQQHRETILELTKQAQHQIDEQAAMFKNSLDMHFEQSEMQSRQQQEQHEHHTKLLQESIEEERKESIQLLETHNQMIQHFLDAIENFHNYVSEPPEKPIFKNENIREAIINARRQIGINDMRYYNFAFAGHAKAGKSSLINAIRGLRSRDDGAAAVDFTECTHEISYYTFPNDQFPYVRLYDLPGSGTFLHNSETYYSDKGLCAFDCLIIMIQQTLCQEDIAFALQALKYNQPVVFVRSRCDVDLDNALKQDLIDEITQEEITKYLAKTALKYDEQIEKIGENRLKNIPCFFVSAFSLRKLVTGESNLFYQETQLLEYITLQSKKSRNIVCKIDATSPPNSQYKNFSNICYNMVSLNWQIPKKSLSDKIFHDAIGIDLGTTRCCCALSRKSGIETVPIENTGDRQLPSYIAYDEEKEKCGKIVVYRLREFHKSTIFDVKRIIGRKFDEIVEEPSWTFSVINDGFGNPLIQTEHCGKLESFSPIQVSATLLKYIKNAAESFQGRKLENVVITVPSIFTGQQSGATIEAAFLAGWKSVKLLPEPIAAAFSYFIDQEIPNNSTMLLFDLGGGTLDICIFKIVEDEIEILSNSGDSNLGGRDFDNVLFEYFKRNLKDGFHVDIVGKRKYKLLNKCQEIKEALSATTEYNFDVEDFDTSKDDAYINITRANFEELSHHLLQKIRNRINAALTEKNNLINANEIATILLVGGGSRMPMIKNLLLEMFPNAEQKCQENPDEVVARGAAYYACHLFSDPETQWITQDSVKEDKVPSDSESRGSQDDDGILLTVHQGPDEVVSKRTMESTATIYSDGRICGNTKLEAKHWIWGFRGGVKIFVYDEKDNLLFESEWTIFGVNMYSDTVRRWGHTMPNPDLFKGKIKSAKIIHEHLYKIDGRRFNISF